MADMRNTFGKMAGGLVALAALASLASLAAACGSGGETAADGQSADAQPADEVADGVEDSATDGAEESATDEGVAVPIDLDRLRGLSWTLRFGGGPDGEIELVEGWPITLTFDRETLGGTAACNGYGSGYQIVGSRFFLEGLGWNEMGCEPAVQAAEQAYFAALRDVDGIDLVGDELALSGPASELIFGPTELVAVDDLIGTLWLLETMITDGVATAVEGEPATLLLKEDGTVTGGTGCRSLSGSYTVFGSEILFPNFAADGDCPQSLRDQDGMVVGVLGDGFVPKVDGETLTLSSVGNEGLGYRAITEDELSTTSGTPAQSDAELLEGVEWTFAGGDGPDGSIADPRTIDPEQEITLTFANGGYGGRAVCNIYSATGTVENGRLSLDGLPASTKVACGQPFDAIVNAYYRALSGIFEFGLEADGGRLVMNNGAVELWFERRG